MNWFSFDQRQLDTFLCYFEGTKSLGCISTNKISHEKERCPFFTKASMFVFFKNII